MLAKTRQRPYAEVMANDGNSAWHQEASGSLKAVLAVFVVILLGALGYLVWLQNAQPTSEQSATPVADKPQQTSQSSEELEQECEFDSVNVNLKPGVTYGLGGQEEFETLVCGYLIQKEENMAFEGEEALIKNRAYLVITKFAESKFKEAIDKQIGEGNSVNKAEGNNYQLGCGCLEDNKLLSDTGELSDQASLAKLLASSSAKPVMVKLVFEVHPGRGCTCCNLVDRLEVI